MDRGAVVSLNARYWAGELTEYDVSALDIGLFVSSCVVGLIALPLCLAGGWGFTAGASLLAGGVGLGIGGVSVVAKELVNTPAHWMNIKLADNRIFLVTGKLDMSQGGGILEIKGGDTIKLEELMPRQFEVRKLSYKLASKVPQDLPDAPGIAACIAACYARGQITNPVGNDYATKSDLEKDGTLDTPVWIYPSFCGVPATDPVCWQGGRRSVVKLS